VFVAEYERLRAEEGMEIEQAMIFGATSSG
jgi:hypothetical protein